MPENPKGTIPPPNHIPQLDGKHDHENQTEQPKRRYHATRTPYGRRYILFPNESEEETGPGITRTFLSTNRCSQEDATGPTRPSTLLLAHPEETLQRYVLMMRRDEEEPEAATAQHPVRTTSRICVGAAVKYTHATWPTKTPSCSAPMEKDVLSDVCPNPDGRKENPPPWHSQRLSPMPFDPMT
ncbi:hypothetical protein JTB14_007755 [Gonioctena quinquepunctata]|nr:hypothetical protein JTB14_007755 [Gonioctena quinquepunctata]